MDRLKSCKKHKHGRRIRQLEKYEQKMKEERQKRIRERQKEFFDEIEVHKYVFLGVDLLHLPPLASAFNFFNSFFFLNALCWMSSSVQWLASIKISFFFALFTEI
jgi:hypothetical protein